MDLSKGDRPTMIIKSRITLSLSKGDPAHHDRLGLSGKVP
jgi:hypothetical protein